MYDYFKRVIEPKNEALGKALADKLESYPIPFVETVTPMCPSDNKRIDTAKSVVGPDGMLFCSTHCARTFKHGGLLND